jgi:hypothetical protein
MRNLSSRLALLIALALVAIPSRASAPVAAFCVSTNATVARDLYTGLVWQKSRALLDWYSALDYCASLKAGPFDSGWRMPTIKELATIANGPQDVQGRTNALDVFTDLTEQPDPVPFWSSTPVVADQDGVWVIAFNPNVPYPSGFSLTPLSVQKYKVTEDDRTTLRKGYVRCVH